MKRWLLFGLCGLMGVGFVFSRGIKVTQPQARDICWKGRTYTIKWETPVPANMKVRIMVFKRKSRPVVVASNIANSGSYDWKVPGKIKSGYYKVRVLIVGRRIKGDSRPFSIQGTPPPVMASRPTPTHGSTNAGESVKLRWKPGANATSHDIYFGTVKPGSPGTFRRTRTASAYNPGTLKPDTTYFWRVDERGPGGKTRGPEWRFSTGHGALPVITEIPPPSSRTEPTHLFALSRRDGSTYKVYLGWRLDCRQPRIGYNVYRKGPGEQTYSRLNAAPITDSTDYVDAKGIKAWKKYFYYVCAVDPVSGKDRENPSGVDVFVLPGTDKYLYRKISKIAENTNKALVKVGDIDGNGLPDFLVVCRGFKITGVKLGGKRELKPDDIHAKVYFNDGRLACDIDMNETERILRAPWTLWDLNGDGKDEVIGTMKSAAGSKQYCLVVIDPTVKPSPRYRILSKINVPSVRPATTRFKTIAIAYLDGTNPYVVYGSGHLMGQRRCVAAYAYDNTQGLKLKWKCEEGPTQGIASSHQFEVADIDGDGKDEVFFGVYVFDENGRVPGYWGGHAWRHVDGVHIGDIRPDIPGQEAYFYIEEAPGGIHLTDRQGRELWKNIKDCPGCKHAHAGWTGNVVKETKGMELWVYYKKSVADDEGEKGMRCPFLYTAGGEKFSGEIDLSWGPVHWSGDFDSDGAKCLEVIHGPTIKRIEASGKNLKLRSDRSRIAIGAGPKMVMDVIGDCREEVIGFFYDFNRNLHMSIYTNTLKNNRRAASPCEDKDRQYLVKQRWAGH
jgi:hypothetical protein